MHSFTISFYIFVIYEFNYCYLEMSGWGYINVHCRDNDNAPVDWWYIYKPPSEDVPYFESGLNFTFVTSSSKGRWEASNKYITTNSMLQYTLAPIFRPTYTDYIAVTVYEKRKASRDFAGSIAYGVIMADEMGGVWIYHTVPGLVNIERDRPMFSNEESVKGHLLMCLSFDLTAMNTIIRNLKQIQPQFIYLKVPRRLRDILPEWNLSESTIISKSLKVVKLETLDNSLNVEILLKPPGNKRPIYKTFASSKNTVLDVYGYSHSKFSPLCGKKYSVRSVHSISLKYTETVFYINNNTDRLHFAVSTVAADRPGKGSHFPREYWTCVSNLDKDVSRVGGDLVCVKNYKIWLAFSNLKVKEPKCYID